MTRRIEHKCTSISGSRLRNQKIIGIFVAGCVVFFLVCMVPCSFRLFFDSAKFDADDNFVIGNISSVCFAFESMSHNFMTTHSRFVPDLKAGVSGERCQDPLADFLRKEIVLRQSAANCSAKNMITTLPMPVGFGSMMSSFVKPFMYSLDNNLVFVSPPLGRYEDVPATRWLHLSCHQHKSRKPWNTSDRMKLPTISSQPISLVQSKDNAKDKAFGRAIGFGWRRAGAWMSSLASWKCPRFSDRITLPNGPNPDSALNPGLNGTQPLTRVRRLSARKTCDIDSTACFFEPLSFCESKLRTELEDEPFKCRKFKRRDCDRYFVIRNYSAGWACINLIDPGETELLAKYSSARQTVTANGLPRSIPKRYRARGLFWYTSQLLGFLFKPNTDLRTIIAERQSRIGWSHMQRPLLSLHVRHGDSCTAAESFRTARSCEGLAVYMEQAVLPLAHKYGIRSIFLATDNSTVSHETKNWPQFRWFFQTRPSGEPRGSLYSDKGLKRGSFDRFLEAQTLLTDLMLLVEGDVFVGKFTSNVDRIAVALMSNRKRGLVPFISLDSTWCSDFGEASGTSELGTFSC